MKRCARCEKTKPRSQFGKNAGRKDGLYVYCTDCTRADRARREKHYRTAAINALGGRCAHCGIEDFRVLCIDHLDGSGAEQRRAGFKQLPFYKFVSENPAGYQALCFNCNWIKRLECDGRAVTELALTA